jgi:glycosyltransferase involved in cell wall biosynthesis
LPFAKREIKGFDFIHAVGNTACAAVLWKPFTKTQVIYDVHGDTLAEDYFYWSKKKSPRTCFWVFQTAILNWIEYRSKDYFITVSYPLFKRLVNQKGVPRERLYLVRNGVDTKFFIPDFTPIERPFTVCYAGGFQVWQGIENLVAAGQLLRNEEIQIKIIGFRKEDVALKCRIKAALGDKVKLIDRLPRNELIVHLSRSHFLVIPRLPHPAVDVAFPTKFSEYLAVGKPVIVSDVDETASLTRSYRCGLVSAPNPISLANTIRQASYLNQTNLIEMGQNGRHLAETMFDWQVVCRKYAKLLGQWHGDCR